MASISLWAVPAPEVRGQVTLTITMADALTFSPSTFSAEPGESVSLSLINAGVLPHTFTLFAEADASVPVSDNSALQTYYNDNTPLRDVDLAGGIQDSVTFTAPTTEGTYTFVCIVSGHSVGGMHGTMTVASPAPPNGEPDGIDPLLIGVVIAIVVIVIAIAAVFILRRRS